MSAPAYTERAARTAAFMDAMHDLKGQLGGTSATPYETLRERYVEGRISLGEFEARVAILLRDTR